ncbi:MAG: type IV secretory system conjugative DNA transfer family protein [Halioglobus sp.]
MTLRTALNDIHKGCGVMVLDPHGELIEDLMLRIPRGRLSDVILLDVSDRDFPISLNPFFNIPRHDHGLVASGMVDAFKAVTGYDDINTPIFDRVINSASRLMLDHPSGTLLDMYYFLSNPGFMGKVLEHSQDLVIKDFWLKDYPRKSPADRERLVGSTLNNLDPFITDPIFRNMFGQKRSSINFREIMDSRQILLVKLPQGEIGLLKSKLIGALILAQIHTQSMRRDSREPFHIFIDEFAYFGTSTVQHMLSGIRKFGVSLTLVHQYANQLSADMQSAIFGTVGTIMCFRIGLEDEAILQSQFQLEPKDQLSGLAPYTAFVRADDTYFLKMPQVTSDTFPEHPERIRRRSRELYAREALKVTLEINAHIRKMP